TWPGRGAVVGVGALVGGPLPPALIFGGGPFPGLGVAGGGAAIVAYSAAGTAVLAAYLWAGRSVLRPKLRVRLRWPMFREILEVGAVAALTSLLTHLTIRLTTRL